MKKTFFLLTVFLMSAGIASAETFQTYTIPGINNPAAGTIQTQNFQAQNPSKPCSGATCRYIPLEPLPGTTNAYGETSQLSALLSGLFKLLITLGSLFAVVMLVVAGIGYMVSEAAVDIEKAKQRARAALWGLLLLTGCWLILYTINPDLLKFNLTIPGSPQNNQTNGGAQPLAPWPPTQAEQNDCTQKLGSIKFNPDKSWTCVYQGMY